ncbi:UNVERIFIED_CONTAM: hypothetical protein NCL1_51234 [Trichonephila clavipes]
MLLRKDNFDWKFTSELFFVTFQQRILPRVISYLVFKYTYVILSLKLRSRLVINTAIASMHRFYMFRDITDVHRNNPHERDGLSLRGLIMEF